MVEKHKFWSRVFAFLPTPTKNNGAGINEERLCERLDHEIENKVDGVCIVGSTGGNGSFSDTEMRKATEVATKNVGKCIALITGTGARTRWSGGVIILQGPFGTDKLMSRKGG